MTEILLKFTAQFYRPDGSEITSVRAVYEDSRGPVVRWECLEDAVTVERVEIREDDGAGNNPVTVGEKMIQETFKKSSTLVIPLRMKDYEL